MAERASKNPMIIDLVIHIKTLYPLGQWTSSHLKTTRRMRKKATGHSKTKCYFSFSTFLKYPTTGYSKSDLSTFLFPFSIFPFSFHPFTEPCYQHQRHHHRLTTQFNLSQLSQQQRQQQSLSLRRSYNKTHISTNVISFLCYQQNT